MDSGSRPGSPWRRSALVCFVLVIAVVLLIASVAVSYPLICRSANAYVGVFIPESLS